MIPDRRLTSPCQRRECLYRVLIGVGRYDSLVALMMLATPCVLLGVGCARQADELAAGQGRAAPLSVASRLVVRDLESSRRPGEGVRFRPPARDVRGDRGLITDGMSCVRRSPVMSFVHVELFAADRVVVVPAGIGVRPPLRTRGADVRGGRCVYPLRTLDPTGLVVLGPGRYTLATLFDLWGQPLSRGVLAGFRSGRHSRVSVFIDGTRWTGEPRLAPLAPYTQVTIEVGRYVPPHRRYAFPSLGWARS